MGSIRLLTEGDEMSKHTKGPWMRSIAGPKHPIHIYAPLSKGAIVAEIGSHDNYNEANAQLIAAAPELLEALEIAVAIIYAVIKLHGEPHKKGKEEFIKIVSTIKKAKGA